MQRYVIWVISAVLALGVYALSNVLGLPQLIVLISTFVGAMAGAIAGSVLMQRRQDQGGQQEQAPPSPGRGSGRKAK